MKANYGIPEIWFAAEDEATLLDTADALGAAGLNTVLVAGSDLVEIPGQNPAESFVFTDEGLRVERDDSEWTVAYDTPAIAVFGRPQVYVQSARSPSGSIASRLSSWGRGFRRPSADADLLELGASPFLDLYVPSDSGPLRISIVQEITNFSLLPENLPHGLSAMQNLVAECENRFENAYVDRRLVDMTLRGIARVVTGAPPPRASTDRVLFRYTGPGRAAQLPIPGSERPPPSRPLIATRVSDNPVADLLRRSWRGSPHSFSRPLGELPPPPGTGLFSNRVRADGL